MSVQTFKIEVAQSILDDLHQRLANTRWPDEIAEAGWEYGTNETYLKELVNYWQTGFDWRKQEAALNQFHHFKTEIDGLNIHFIHERGKGPNPMPLILTHGWPDSFFRYLKLIPMLTDPAAYGGDPADSFDVIVPSVPGYGFSDHVLKGDITARKVSDIWTKLMAQLGYQRFAAHGGDIGVSITTQLGLAHPDNLVGIHLNSVPFEFAFQRPDDLKPEEQKFLADVAAWRQAEGGYIAMHTSKPQTLSYGLSDSPVGMASWIIEKFRTWSDCNGDIEQRFSKDELLTNLMIYWSTNSIASSIRYYLQVLRGFGNFTEGRVSVPVGFSIFPKDIVPPPRVWGERWFDITQWTNMPRGGHFAALEEPELEAEDLRSFFGRFR